MASSNYFVQRSKDCTKKTREIIKEMPDFMYDYFVGIENATSELTRLNYAYDLRTFFTFLFTSYFPCGILITEKEKRYI